MKPKDPSFWSEEEDLELISIPSEEDEIKSANTKHTNAQVPPGFYAITCGGTRVVILDRLGKDWSELLCYNLKLRCVQHLKKEDLRPKDSAHNAVEFLKKVMA